MYTMNQLTLIGFTGQDAEIHYTQNGTLVTTLSVATKESWKNAEGAWQSRSEWHRWSYSGRSLSTRARWPRARSCWCKARPAPANTTKDGVKHRVFEVRAETIGKLDRAERQEVGEQNTAE